MTTSRRIDLLRTALVLVQCFFWLVPLTATTERVLALPQPKQAQQEPRDSKSSDLAKTARGVPFSDWFGSRRVEDGLWNPPSIAPDESLVEAEYRRVKQFAKHAVLPQRLQLVNDVLEGWLHYYSRLRDARQAAADAKKELLTAEAADDVAGTALCKKTLAKQEERIAKLQLQASAPLPDAKTALRTAALANIALGPFYETDYMTKFSIGVIASIESLEDGAKVPGEDFCNAWCLFAIDYRNLAWLDQVLGRRAGATAQVVTDKLQALATLLAQDNADTTEVAANQWLLGRVNTMKRLLRKAADDAAPLDVKAMQAVADEVLHWYADADPMTAMRPGEAEGKR